MYLVDMIQLPYPTGLLARMLLQRIDALQILSFRDNEKGAEDDIRVALSRSVIAPVNSRLRRARKPLKLVEVQVSAKAHHQIQVVYHLDGAMDSAFFEASIYPEPRRAKAKRTLGKGAESEMSPPARGKRRGKKKKKAAVE